MADQTARPEYYGFSAPSLLPDEGRRAEDTRPLHILLVEDHAPGTPPQPGTARPTAPPGGTEPTIVRAASLANALKALASAAFDVVLLDLELSDFSGFATMPAVLPWLGKAALVVLTGTEDDPVAMEAVRRGATDYLLKSDLDPRHLRRKLRYALDRRAPSNERSALRQLQATLDGLHSHIAVLDHAGTIIIVNAAWREFAAQNGNRDPAAGMGASYVQACENATGTAGVTGREVATAIREVAAGLRDSWHGQYPCHSPTEQRSFFIKMTACPEADLAVIIQHENVTDRRQLGEALRSSNERFSLVRLATNDVIWDWELSRPGSATADIAAAWEERVHPEDLERVRGSLNSALVTADAWTTEYRYRRGDGSYVVVYDRRYLLRDAAGRAVRLIGSMQDVTEQHRLTTALEHSEAHYRRRLVFLTGDTAVDAAERQGGVSGVPLLTTPIDLALLSRS